MKKIDYISIIAFLGCMSGMVRYLIRKDKLELLSSLKALDKKIINKMTAL